MYCEYRGGVYIQYTNEKGWARARKGDGEAGNGEREHPPTLVHAHIPPPTHTYTHTEGGVSVVVSNNHGKK